MVEKRAVFEDVSGDIPADMKRDLRGVDTSHDGARRAIRIWLGVLFTMVFVMIVVGGLTRLTDSGLSITEWKPITGAIPPTSEAVWTEVFEKYKATPEYDLQNKGMSLAQFKGIYWWEWSHRQLGRSIGLVWALPFLVFLIARRIPRGWTVRLLAIGVLGGAQGALGWWMVASGLTGRMVDVASYRLAMHLGLAFIILGLIAWYIMALGRSSADLMRARRAGERSLALRARVLSALVFVQILLGALVAGIDAGRSYIDWPLMNGDFLPPESFELTPLWSNFFENPALVQFDHRMLGYFVVLYAIFIWWRSRRSALRAVKKAFSHVLVVVLVQMGLGISTVIMAAPWDIAIVHQIGAVLTLTLILRARFAALYPTSQSLR